MKKIYLFCNAGMSTSLMAKKMQDVADANSLPLEIKAYPDARLDAVVADEHPDEILLGPQVKFMYEKIRDLYEPKGIPVQVIDTEDYGSMNGERALKRALLYLKQFRQEERS